MGRKKLGFVVNPIAGMGGTVGLKGTDGSDTLKRAIELGAKPIAPSRASETLYALRPIKEEIELIAYPSKMGADYAVLCGYTPKVIGRIASERTSSEDTIRAARLMEKMDVDLLIFCGGDGTARDILYAINQKIPVVGIPSGVKMYSEVFAFDPRSAAELVMSYLKGEVQLRLAEVVDIDEEAFRKNKLSISLKGYLQTPYKPTLIQGTKIPSPEHDDEKANQSAIAEYLVEGMEKDTLYILGPGTTVKALTDLLNLEKTLLGVDLLWNGKIIASDVNEREILSQIKGKKAKIVISPTGKQGIIFGRGNQQISPEVIKEVGKENIIIAATKYKLSLLDGLRIDSGDKKLDQEMKGYVRVYTSYREEKIVPLR